MLESEESHQTVCAVVVLSEIKRSGTKAHKKLEGLIHNACFHKRCIIGDIGFVLHLGHKTVKKSEATFDLCAGER